MKKATLFILALALTGLSLTACSFRSALTPAAPTEAATEAPVDAATDAPAEASPAP